MEVLDHNKYQHLLNQLYDAYHNDILQYVFFMLGDYNQARDIMQDTFLQAYHHLQTFQGENYKGWLSRIARNLTIDYVRKQRPIAYFLEVGSTSNINESSPEQIAMMNESEKELYLALSNLKHHYRDVIVLRKIKELSIKETSYILGWSENKVKVNLFRGMKALKKELNKVGYIHE